MKPPFSIAIRVAHTRQSPDISVQFVLVFSCYVTLQYENITRTYHNMRQPINRKLLFINHRYYMDNDFTYMNKINKLF